LLAWLGMGIAGGAASWAVRRWRPDHFSPSLSDAGFELWGIGFLALILFGFYMRVRNVRL
ncbi:MAG TPA: hypothetical protein VJ732_01265, partial [Bryobacteraceae bacterium]|nr:hypothetical protein [Bryobacteraceae bacterium]